MINIIEPPLALNVFKHLPKVGDLTAKLLIALPAFVIPKTFFAFAKNPVAFAAFSA